MKKIFSIVSLVLAALMLVVSPAAQMFVEGDTYVIPEGVVVYYAKNVSDNAPSIDGTIEEGEYGQVYRLSTPVATTSKSWGGAHQEEAPVDPTAVSEYIEVSFAYDEEYVYVAIYEMGPKEVEGFEKLVPSRSNYTFYFGFDPNDAGTYFSLHGYATNVQWVKGRGNGGEFSAYESNGVMNPTPINADLFIEECIVKKTDVTNGIDVGFGDLITSNGNVNYTDGQCALTVEFKINKEMAAAAMNECYFTSYDTIADAMFFGMQTMTYTRDSSGDAQYYKWFGQTDTRGADGKASAQFAEYGIPEGSSREFMFDLVVLADEGTDIRVADPEALLKVTEAPETEAPADDVTEAPADDVTEAPAADDVTEAPATEEPAKSGCGASVSLAGLALVAALGTCTVFVAKKKED